MHNFKKMTIIEHVIKIFSSIAVVPVSRYEEAKSLLGKKQAVSNQGRECVGRYAALLKIAQGQRLRNRPTYRYIPLWI